ncbi:MAG: hypothetical protein HOV81_17370, partial [Kofleriaceae bacterium]|nr:hypothetical protein [Kofleriaceae bacterium]
TWSFVAAILFPPIALAFSTRIRTAATLVTLAVTLIAALVANLWFVPDPSDTGSLVLFFLALGPAFAVPTAALVATLFAPPVGFRIAAFFSAVVAGILGWAIGLVIMHVVEPFAPSRELLLRLIGIAPPAIYCACGAVLATSWRPNRT